MDADIVNNILNKLAPKEFIKPVDKLNKPITILNDGSDSRFKNDSCEYMNGPLSNKMREELTPYTMANRFTPVSYTHLDVYKRQLFERSQTMRKYQERKLFRERQRNLKEQQQRNAPSEEGTKTRTSTRTTHATGHSDLKASKLSQLKKQRERKGLHRRGSDEEGSEFEEEEEEYDEEEYKKDEDSEYEEEYNPCLLYTSRCV